MMNQNMERMSLENQTHETFKSTMNIQTFDRIFENYDYFDDLL